MWLYPYLTWATAALIVFVLGYMLTDTEHDGRETVLLSLLVAAVVLVIAVIRQRTGRGTVVVSDGPDTATEAVDDGDDVNDVVKVG